MNNLDQDTFMQTLYDGTSEEDKKFMYDLINENTSLYQEVSGGNFTSEMLMRKSDPMTAQLIQELTSSKPSDEIILEHADAVSLCTYWTKDKLATDMIPSDIFFANTIPLKDALIKVLPKNYQKGNSSQALIGKYRVRVRNYYDALKLRSDIYQDGINHGYEFDCGLPTIAAIVNWYTDSEVYPDLPRAGSIEYIFGIIIRPGNQWIAMTPPYIKGIPESDYDTNPLVMQAIPGVFDMLGNAISTWYGIQVSLLHPAVKEVFSKPVKVTYQSTCGNKPSKKKKVKYIKRHKITTGAIESSISEFNQKRGFNRKTLVWYVIGHWRKSRKDNGKRTFIQGYWKGPLRDTKQNTGDTRERVIAKESIK